MQTLAAHPLPAEGFVGMEIRGDRLTDKENAGAALLDTPKHGYAVMQFVEEKTGGRLSLGAGTLYGALNSLQDKKWMGKVF